MEYKIQLTHSNKDTKTMLEHIIGICHDNHIHFDLLDLLFIGGGSLTAIWWYVKGRTKEVLGIKEKEQE